MPAAPPITRRMVWKMFRLVSSSTNMSTALATTGLCLLACERVGWPDPANRGAGLATAPCPRLDAAGALAAALLAQALSITIHLSLIARNAFTSWCPKTTRPAPV